MYMQGITELKQRFDLEAHLTNSEEIKSDSN